MTQTAKAVLIALQALQTAFILLHDWVPLGRLSNLEAVKSSDSRIKLVTVTVLSTLPFALPLTFCCVYWNAPRWPMWLQTWLLYTYGISCAAILYAWWVPYLFGTDPQRAERYRLRFAGTMKFLPQRHGFAPDTLHVLYHSLAVATLVLLIMK